MGIVSELSSRRSAFLRRPQVTNFKGEDFMYAHQRGASLDDRNLSPWHRYGDVSINYHYQDMVNGRQGATLYWSMPQQATLYHDPGHPWYEGIRATSSFIQAQQGYTFMRAIPAFFEAILVILVQCYENMVSILMALIALLCIYLMVTGYNEQAAAAHHFRAATQQAVEQATVAKAEAAQQTQMVNLLMTTLTEVRKTNEALHADLKDMRTEQSKLRDQWLASQVAMASFYADEPSREVALKKKKVRTLRKSTEGAGDYTRQSPASIGAP